MRMLAVTITFFWLAPLWVADARQIPDCDSPRHDLLLACLSDRLAAADVQLNEAYRRLLSRLNADEATELRKTQRNWMAFRDASCEETYAEVHPGREASIDQMACLEQKTLFRTRLLATEIEALEGIDPILRALRIDAEVLTAGLGSSSSESTRLWLEYINAHCSEARIESGYESRHLCVANHRLVDY